MKSLFSLVQGEMGISRVNQLGMSAGNGGALLDFMFTPIS
jgi:hypothetical protein